MAANEASKTVEPQHEYHAEAHALSGHLELPVDHEIRKQAAVALNDWRGGHVFQGVDNYNLEGVISFKSSYTHVSGNPSNKEGHEWVTLATSVVEGLNVLDVITVDRITAQVSTEHPRKGGYVPRVTFLGTRFENLQVGGHEVKVVLDLGICGDKPQRDQSYLAEPLLGRVNAQRTPIWKNTDLPTKVRAEYDEEQRKFADARNQNGFKEAKSVKCSLVKSIEPVPGVTICGNLLQISNFGVVSLADVEVGVKPVDDPESSHPYSHYFTLTMMNMWMGCIGEGMTASGIVSANGHTRP
jgi:hypothetical protein